MKHTITSNEEVNRLFNDADKSIQANLIVLCAKELPERGQNGRVAYIAGKRLGNAPKRNRAKRLLREAARLEGAPWSGYRVVLVARNACLENGIDGIRKDLARAFAQLNRQYLTRTTRQRQTPSELNAETADIQAVSHLVADSTASINIHEIVKETAEPEMDWALADGQLKAK